MRIKRVFERKWLIFLILVVVILLLVEFLTYKLNTYSWKKLRSCNTKKCIKILLVSDPQLIGLRNEIIHSITPLSIFDSDRYISTTYSYAFDFVKPNVVIFLGDLFDEGSTASESDFRSYLKRLFKIFLTGPSAHVKHIWLPGDNDIGGEGGDFVTELKIKRFYRAFQQPDIIHYNNLDFYKINIITRSIPPFSDKKDFYNTSRIVIGLSHISALFTPSIFSEKVISKLQPHLLFSGHNHQSMIIAVDNLIRNERHITPINRGDGPFECKLGDINIYDILVPTCSYRMGTTKIGYGYAVIDDTNLQYTVLWSHSRFDQLLYYSIFLILFSVFFCFKFKNK